MITSHSELLTNQSLARDVMVRLGFIGPLESIQVKELSGGVSSTILEIEGSSGRYCLKQPLPLLKVAKLWAAPVERVYAEIAWLELAGSIIPGCAPKLRGVDKLTNSFVMSFLPPDDFPNWKAELLNGRVDPSFATLVAAKLVHIHARTAGQEKVCREFSNDDSFLSLRLDPYLLETARRHPSLATTLRALVAHTQSQKRALVHGDVSPKNILVGAAGPVFLDAECACYGDPAFDVAFLLNHLLLKSVAVRDRSAILLDAFDAFRDSYLSGVTWEPRRNIERRVATLLPALTLARISGKSPVEYLTPPMRDAIAMIAATLVATPPANLEALKRLWKKGLGI